MHPVPPFRVPRRRLIKLMKTNQAYLIVYVALAAFGFPTSGVNAFSIPGFAIIISYRKHGASLKFDILVKSQKCKISRQKSYVKA